MYLSKCEFGKGEVTYLDKVGQGHTMPKEANMESVLNFPVPNSKKNVKTISWSPQLLLQICAKFSRSGTSSFRPLEN